MKLEGKELISGPGLLYQTQVVGYVELPINNYRKIIKEINQKINFKKYGFRLTIPIFSWCVGKYSIEVVPITGILSNKTFDNIDLNELNCVLKQVLKDNWDNIKTMYIPQIIGSKECVKHNKHLCIMNENNQFSIYRKAYNSISNLLT